MKSLRARLTLRLFLGGLLLLGAAGAIFQWQMTRALTHEFDDGLRLTAQSLQAFVEQKNSGIKIESDVDDMPQFKQERGDTLFLLRHSDGKEIRRSRSLGDQTLPLIGGPQDRPLFFETKLGDGRKLRCIGMFLRVRYEHEENYRSSPPLSFPLLVVGRVISPLEHTLGELRNALIISGVVTLAGLSGLLLWGVRQGFRPLDELGKSISAVDASSLATRFPVDPLPSELQPITRCLNDLLARLEAVFEREKRFTANVAHELRTPLTELRALAEVNLMVPPSSPAENAACWQDVSHVSSRMESLALRLLELVRSEHAHRTLRPEGLNPAAMVESVGDRFATQAEGRNITCELTIPSIAKWHSDKILVDLILTNLIGNAVQHAPSGSTFEIQMTDAVLCFSNEAPGLEASDLPDLFERFWKKDASRTDGNRHGLGLALARETAELLGGSLDASLTADGILQLKLRLPSEPSVL